jgi:hypothetical protein
MRVEPAPGEHPGGPEQLATAAAPRPLAHDDAFGHEIAAAVAQDPRGPVQVIRAVDEVGAGRSMTRYGVGADEQRAPACEPHRGEPVSSRADGAAAVVKRRPGGRGMVEAAVATDHLAGQQSRRRHALVALRHGGELGEGSGSGLGIAVDQPQPVSCITPGEHGIVHGGDRTDDAFRRTVLTAHRRQRRAGADDRCGDPHGRRVRHVMHRRWAHPAGRPG